MLKVLFFILTTLSCRNQGNSQNGINKKPVEELKKQKEDEKKIEEKIQKAKEFNNNLNSLISLIINNNEDLEKDLENFKAILKTEYLNYYINFEDENINGKTLLILAIEAEKVEFVQLLLEYKELDVNKKSKEEKAPLEYAIVKKNLAIIEELLKRDEIFIEHKYFTLYSSFEEFRNIDQILEASFKKRVELSRNLYKIFLINNEENIKNLINEGANLNYFKYSWGQYSPLIEDYINLLRDKDTIKSLFKYGLKKDVFMFSLISLFSNAPNFNIDLDYLKFLIEEIKIDLSFEVQKEKRRNNFENPEIYTLSLSEEIYKKIKGMYKEVKNIKGENVAVEERRISELMKYFINLNTIDWNNMVLDNGSVHILIELLNEYDYETVMVFLNKQEINIKEIFEKYSPQDSSSFIYNRILYSNPRSEEQNIKILKILFEKGLPINYIKGNKDFSLLKEVKDATQGKLKKAKDLIKTYYTDVKFE